ncbi:hypothetical protein QYE76_030734 [Lolium multiflorum]|uniref:Transposase (putative) gypsy type domain-containing protein n=1 Tax=Lolium multiflorum TaxID=4521 RepID=A0AAD8QRS0_LOLMU|nr:hypothetical protein QYE76_030734 [Lolium multiflorum]
MEDVEISGWEGSKLTNQDKRSLKKLGLMKKKDSLIFPGDESAPNPPIGYRVIFIDHLVRGLSTPVHEFLRGLLFIYGIQLHQLTPNSILHISLFITLCECFLGAHPHWGLSKRIFYLRCNNSRSIVYNVGGACICVRPDVDYFDVKFPDSVQGWHKRWLYIKDEYVGNQEYGIAPSDGAAKLLRRWSWDVEASSEEKTATDALMKRIHQLQNTHGEELPGIQITAYFLRIRVEPLQARKNPLWMYAGEEDVDRISKDLSIKDLEKLTRRFSSLSKKDKVPTSCRVEPYSGSHALPEVQLEYLRALDSPSVISQLVSPPQTSRVGISAESENSSDNFDDASTVLDNTGSLGPFLDATIARSRQIENTETPNENLTPVNSPEIDDLDEDYVELDDDFIDKCNATTSTKIQLSGKSSEFMRKVLFSQNIDGAKGKAGAPRPPHTRPAGGGALLVVWAPRRPPDALLWTTYAFRPKNARGSTIFRETIQYAAAIAKLRLGTRNSVLHSAGTGNWRGIFTAITTDASIDQPCFPHPCVPELTTPMLRLTSIVCLPLCRINNLGNTSLEDAIPYTCGSSRFVRCRSVSPPPAVSPRNKRKRGDFEDSCTSKTSGSPADETSPEDEDAFHPYEDAGSVSSSEGEEEGPTILGTAPTSTSNTAVLSEENRIAAESSPPPQPIMETSTPPSSPRASSPKRAKTGAGDVQTLILGSSSTPMFNDPLMDQFIRLGSQSIGFRNEADTLKVSLQQVEERAEALEAKLKLTKRLARRLKRMLLPSRIFASTQPKIFAELVKRFLPEEDLALAYQQENLKIGVEGTIALVANNGQEVDWARAGDSGKMNKEKWKALVKDAKPHSKKIIAFLSPKPAGSTSTAKTELVFDNYTATAGPFDASPATSHSRKTYVDDVVDDSSQADLLQELNELRQQLQSMKKQAVVVMDQSRKSSDRELAALQQAQEALKLKVDAAAEASRASQCKDYMLDLMAIAGQDMSGM